jgi:uncharacterized repeat protein (TIGR01451 family)
MDLEKNESRGRLSLRSMLLTILLQFGFMATANADFINGGFEDAYTTSGTVTNDPINGWTLKGYLFNGSPSTTLPTSISGINLGSETTPGGIVDIYDASNPSNPDDYFLFGATPAPTLLLPGTGLQSASVNLRSGRALLAKSGTTPITGWVTTGKRATSISQQITIQPSDFDPVDNKVHIRFIAAPVLENPAHNVNQQPFFAIQLNNITTGRVSANPLFFQWNFASQPGTPWKDLSAGAGTQLGSNTSYQYTEWQSFDISPGNAFIHVGDTIEVVVIASGCSLGGHEGHVYVDDMHTTIPSSLWVNATGPASTTPGSNVTYTYTYTNNGSTPVSNVTVVANLPQGMPPLVGGVPGPVTAAQNTNFVSNTNPTTGSCTGSGPVTCSIGTLQPGQTGTFSVTVAIPGSWVVANDGVNTTGPVNNGNYPISGTGVTTLLGPLVQTALVAPSALSNLVANTSGMPTTAVVGTAYNGSYTCTNASNLSAAGDAPNASCDITNLPAGLVVSGCTISPSNIAWTQPATIPAGETVTCDVSGTPSSTGTVTGTVTANASNNSNSTNNIDTAPITVSASDMVAAASLPASATVGIPYTGSFTCTNNSAITATSVNCGITGLPSGLTATCRGPSNTTWVNGSSLTANQGITCTVSGTPSSTGNVTPTVTTNASNQANTANDTSVAPITIGNAASDMFAASSLPATAKVFSPYTGSFTCTNSSAVTALSVQCGVSGLPNGVAVTSCSSPLRNPWVNGSSLPGRQTVTCRASGTPKKTGRVIARVVTNASNQVNTSNDIRSTVITVNTVSVPGTLRGSPVLNAATVCCGRPVILHNLPGVGVTTYRVTVRTGNVSCVIGRSGSQIYLKMNGTRGSCTVTGTKNGVTTLPLTIHTP